MMMVWDFVKRHRRKFLFTGAVIGGGLLLTKYFSRKMKEMEEKEISEYCELVRKDHHFENTQKTCSQTTLSLVTNLKEGISKLLDSDALTAVLKMQPTNKIEVWDELKVIGFMRTVVMVYSVSMLAILMKVELNILGGYMYVDAGLSSKKKSSFSNIPQDVQRQFLNSVQHLLGLGLDSLILAINSRVKEIVLPLSLKSKLALKDVIENFSKIRNEIEAPDGVLYQNLTSYMLGPIDSDADANLTRMLEETKDILNSEDCQKVFKIAVDCGFAQVKDCITEYFNKSGSESEFINPHTVTIPLAKLVPVLNNLLFSQCTDQPGQLLYQIIQLESLKTLGANIYEAFSQVEVHEDMRNHNIKL